MSNLFHSRVLEIKWWPTQSHQPLFWQCSIKKNNNGQVSHNLALKEVQNVSERSQTRNDKTLHDSTYMRLLQEPRSQRQKVGGWVPGAGEGETGSQVFSEYKVWVWDDGKVLEMCTVLMGARQWECASCHLKAITMVTSYVHLIPIKSNTNSLVMQHS